MYDMLFEEEQASGMNGKRPKADGSALYDMLFDEE